MAHHARPLETVMLDFRGFVRDLTRHCWDNDGHIDPNERTLIARAEHKLRRITHINATRAACEYLERLEVDGEISDYGQRKAAEANLSIVRPGDASKVVPFRRRDDGPESA